ncbi:MAG: hypothetical protein AAB639_03135 [Patescibacteria group bacterium]
MFKKETLPLIIGIGLPILLIIYVAVTAYLPSLFNKPQYNFIYATGYDNQYATVENGTIKVNPPPYSHYELPRPPQFSLYLYDVSQSKTKLISQDEAKLYRLDPSDKSPDGYVVTSNRDTSFSVFPFFYGGYDRGYYLKGHGVNKRISERDYDFKFLGWVVS